MENFSVRLLDWFTKNKRPMPWRGTREPYHIWLSEVMLQQTQVSTVISYYNRFIQKYPTLETLASATDEDVLKLWEGLGYYRRCHNFLNAVRMVRDQYHGIVPADPDAFKDLPGVGAYTQAAVLSIAFDKALPVVDGNVIRVVTRVYRITEDSTKTGTRHRIHQRMQQLIPAENPGDFNQAVMELGALVCTPKNPACDVCPLTRDCGAFQDGAPHLYPNIPKKEKIPEYQVGLAVIWHDGKFLIQKRPSIGHLAGLWEFPGGKCENGESPEQALDRKCREELGLGVRIVKKLTTVTHGYSHFKIQVKVFWCEAKKQVPKALKNQPLAWIGADELEKYPFPSANHKFFPLLLDLDP